LKGNRPVNFETTQSDWNDFWEEQTVISQHYSEEDLNAMCDAAEEKENCREYNLREAEYYTKRAELDAQTKVDGYSVSENPMTYDQMIAAGWTMTADGFWVKE